jgi:flagellar biosynthesis protein FlhF
VRSQAGPIATAARLREASILAAAEMTAAMQPVQIDTPRAMAVAPVAPVAPVMQQPVAPVAPAIEKAPAAPAIAGWSWQQLVAAPVVATPVVAVVAPNAAPRQEQAAVPPVIQAPVQPAVEAPVQPVAQAPVQAAPEAAVPPAAQAPVQASMPAVAPASVDHVRPAQPEGESRLLAELQSMRDMLRQQIATLATKPAAEGVAPTAPAKRVMTRLLTAGFSVEVARRIAAHVPQDVDAAQAERWLHEVLAHNVRCADAADGIVERAGQPGTPGQIFALVGPTGVGKTTTVAKLAARFAVRHGTSALGLITLDAYRVAAPEQLRAYGRILGTPVHLAQDSATLRELLSTMVHKRLVLIDTCGVSQRDERLGEMLDLLATSGTASRPIRRVLLLNSASHAETLDEAARAWRAQDCTGAILTKLDEATRIGGSLDVSLRHRLTLLGVTNGQRVPEDWHAASSKLLAHLALKPAAHLFELADEEGAALVQVPPAETNAAVATHGALHG